jgi:3-isopropylmalate dehydrogenase
VGGPKWERITREHRPERALLSLRSELELFANLRPALLFPELADASTLKPEIVSGLDIMIVRELTGGIYFGQPRALTTDDDGVRMGFNTMVYREPEIRRIAHSAFIVARQRGKRVCSVDKANVMEVSELWREIVTEVGTEYPDVELSHMYIDNACMQLVRAPKQFDVIVTSNLFGDILSDAASMLTGSIGMLPSASLDANNKGMYEPVHGSAPDIAGQNLANPLATILSVAMMLRSTFENSELADKVDGAVRKVLADGLRTGDIARPGETALTTSAMGDAVVSAIA